MFLRSFVGIFNETISAKMLCVVRPQSRCSVTTLLSLHVRTVAAWSWRGNATATTIASTCLTSRTVTSRILAATAGPMSSRVASFTSVFIERGFATETMTARITPMRTCLDVRTFCFLATVTDLTLLMYALVVLSETWANCVINFVGIFATAVEYVISLIC